MKIHEFFVVCDIFSIQFLCDFTIFLFRPNPLQYFLVPDIEVENGEDEDDDEEIEEEIGKFFPEKIYFTGKIR